MITKKRSIGEAAKEVGVDAHVIRFWQIHFPEIAPEIGRGKRRYYYDSQIARLNEIKHYLYSEGYTISGLKKFLDKKKDEPKAASKSVSNIANDVLPIVANAKRNLEKLKMLLAEAE